MPCLMPWGLVGYPIRKAGHWQRKEGSTCTSATTGGTIRIQGLSCSLKRGLQAQAEFSPQGLAVPVPELFQSKAQAITHSHSAVRHMQFTSHR